jgi:ferric-dicitrate binding protein FerR (iron transport regulator)
MLAAALALGAGTAASSEPVSGTGGAVSVDLARSELRLSDGSVLRVDAATAIRDVDLQKDISLADIKVREGVLELPVRYHGQSERGAIRALRIDIGESAIVN